MALGQAALCKNAVTLELKELNTIRLSTESILALEACLLDVYRMLHPKPGDYEQRAVLVRAFNMLATDALGTHGGFPVVEAFGSYTMDLFTAGSDLDLSINFSDDYTTQIPRDQKISILRKFSRFLYKLQRKGVISKVLPILRARVPVVKVVDSGTGIECDVSAENKDGVSRSSILTIVSSIDERFRILSYLMKAWAKANDINSSRDRTMNSLSIISLVAFHLQTRDPPILPPFSVLIKDGTDVSSMQRVAVGFKNFGRRNEESIAILFGTLLIKLSAVESLWPLGLCASTFEGSWIKRELVTGRAKDVANISIEDFLDRSENFARSVGVFEAKKIYNCIKGSVKILSRFLEGEIGEIELKEVLFGSSSLNVPNVQLTGGQVGSKRPISIFETDRANPTTAKMARYVEAPKEHQNFQTTSSTLPLPNPFIPVNPNPASQISRVEGQVNSFEHLQSGYDPQYQRYPPIAQASNPTGRLAPFPPGHMENRLKPFEAPKDLQQNLQTTSSTLPNPFIPLNPHPASQISRVEGQVNSFEHLQSGYDPQYQRYPPIAPASNPTGRLAPFPPGHMENRLKPFETSQTWHGPYHQPRPPIPPQLANTPQFQPQRPFPSHPSFSFESQGQPPWPPVTPHEGHVPRINTHGPNASQSSYGIEHHPNTRVPPQFSFDSGHHQPGRNL